MKKRLLATLLALCLIVGLFPAMALAADETKYTFENNVVYKQIDDGEKIPLSADELATFSGVHLYGIAGFETTIFPTMEDAYTAINAKLTESGGMTWGSGPNNLGTDDAFNAVFIDRLPAGGEHEGVALTWTIFGTVDLGSELSDYYLSGGRQDAYYGSDARTIRAITVAGYGSNAQLNISKNPIMPKQWWGETTDSFLNFSFENLTLVGSRIGVSSNYRTSFDVTFENCKIQGFLYHYFQHEGNVIINNCVFDGTGTNQDYAFHVQGGSEKSLTIQFTNNNVSGYPRGINIDQKLAVATISGNTIEADHSTRGAVQLTAGSQITVTDNTIKNASGSAFWFYKGYNCPITTITNNIIESPYLFQVGDADTPTLSDTAKSGITFTGNDLSKVADRLNSPVKDQPGKISGPHEILSEDDTGNIIVSGVTLDMSSLTLYVGSTDTLTATVLPDNAPDKTVTWSSSNNAVATVDEKGAVKAVGVGTAVITATTNNGGKTASCTINVLYPYIPPIVNPTTPTTPVEPDQPDQPDTPGALPFVDVSAGDWYYEDVAYVYAQGIMTGSTATSFAPNDAMTRAMVWTVLGRMSGENVEGGTPWYALAQAWAVSDGVSDGTEPNSSITREQLVTMLYRQAGSPEVGVSELALLGRFTDGESVSDWAEEAMAWAVSQGILTGDGDLLRPQATATRAQVAAILARYCQTNEK